MSEKRAIILAGGKGRRLAPYTFVIPKPIVPIGNTPILEIVLTQLAARGFGHVSIALGHLSEIVRAVAGDGTKYGIRIDYSDEDQPLGTIGPLARIGDLPEHFLVMNADLLTDLDFSALWDDHVGSGAIATVATYEKTTQLQLGVLSVDPSRRIVAFREKPELRHEVSMGIYVFRREILEHVPKDRYFGFDHLMDRLLEKNLPVHAFRFGGRWLDIGIPADYERAQDEFESNRRIYLPGGADPGDDHS
jgi:NDP-sugar pyrophosphorylase family protein